MRINIGQTEYDLIRAYIKKVCGITLSDSKKYLVETRLTRLVVESGASSFSEFYQKISISDDPKLRDKIIDAMTTNETLWFRDSAPYETLQEELLPKWVKKSKHSKIRIWSAACSTGQEPYSVAMIIDDFCKRRSDLTTSDFEILATDISPSALFIAISGRYDSISMNRGFVEHWLPFKNRYFTTQGRVSIIEPQLKSMVTFKRLNLQDSFSSIGTFDLILLRNVAIYFSQEFKKDLFTRIAKAITKDGHLFLGTAENLTGYSTDLTSVNYKRYHFYRN